MNKKTFAEKLKAYRKELETKRGERVGQIKLADELGISKGNIGDLERGKRTPSKKLLVKLAEHSGKSLEYWMEGLDEIEIPNTVDLVLDKMIEEGLIKDAKLDDDVWDIIKKAVILEIERKLN